MIVKTGRIVGLHYQWGSGLARLRLLNDQDKEAQEVYCEAGPTFRALRDAFGESMGANMEIEYSVDGMGVMEGFNVVEA